MSYDDKDYQLHVLPGYRFAFDKLEDIAKEPVNYPDAVRHAFMRTGQAVIALGKQLNPGVNHCASHFPSGSEPDDVMSIYLARCNYMRVQFNQRTIHSGIKFLPVAAIPALMTACGQMFNFRKVVGREIIGTGLKLKTLR